MPQYNTDIQPDLLKKLKKVKRQCEARRRIHGWIRFGILAAVTTPLATWILSLTVQIDAWRNLFLLAYTALMALLLWKWVLRHFAHPVSLEQVALFIDENYPELQNRVVNMVSVNDPKNEEKATVVVEAFLNESQAFLRDSAFVYHHSYRGPKGQWIALALVLFSFFIISRFSDLWTPSSSFSWTSNHLGFSVDPGNAKVQRGADQIIFVNSEITNKAVSIRFRRHDGWERTPMALGSSEQVHYHLFKNIQESIEYQVVFGSQRSPIYRLNAWVPPELQAIDLTYHYPDYLDLPPKTLPNSGDITAIEGATVLLQAQVNKPLKRVTMILQSGTQTNLEETEPLTWTTRFPITTDDKYHLELEDEKGENAIFNPSYDITAVPDNPPKINIDFPQRDMEVTLLDEISFQFRVTDDFGIAGFGIYYEVAGREPITVPLNAEEAMPLMAEGHHQLQLENLNLQTGDLLTWTVWAKDQNPNRPEYREMGDPYFLEIRPFQRRFREAVSNQQGGQGGGGDDLITKQKEIFIATWNLRKKIDDMELDPFIEERQIIIDNQSAVKQAVTQNMSASDPKVAELMEQLETSHSLLDEAIWPEPQSKLSQAAVAQQSAYRLLLALQPPEAQISRSRSMNGAQGGQRRDMAGMNELDMKRNRNFYEDEKRTKQQQEAAADALEKIKDLARRQKMINQEIAKLISEQKTPAADQTEISRRLEKLREEAKKSIEELDRLQREIASSEMDPQSSKQAQNKLDQARQEMNRSFENLKSESLQQARGASTKAVQNLDQLEKDLTDQARGSAKEQMANLQEELKNLAELQQSIQKKLGELENEKDSPRLTTTDPTQKNKTDLLEDKDRLAESFSEMMKNAAHLSNFVQGNQEALSRKLGDWLRKTSQEGVVEDIEETRTLAQHGIWEDLPEKEAAIAQKLARAREKLDTIAGQIAGDELEAKEKALEQLKALQNLPLPENSGSQPGEMNEKTLLHMQQFAESGYRQWMDRLETAQGLLSENAPVRQNLNEVRRNVENMRRRFRRNHLVPKFDLFMEQVVKPLGQSVGQLTQEIQSLKKEREFVLNDDGSIPDHYRKTVSEYFQTLSESEGY